MVDGRMVATLLSVFFSLSFFRFFANYCNGSIWLHGGYIAVFFICFLCFRFSHNTLFLAFASDCFVDSFLLFFYVSILFICSFSHS